MPKDCYPTYAAVLQYNNFKGEGTCDFHKTSWTLYLNRQAEGSEGDNESNMPGLQLK